MQPLSEGSQAPDFALRGVDGKMYSLSEALKQGPLLAVFIKTSCPTCDLILPYLNHLAETYRREGWQLWAVSQDDAEASRRYAERFKASFPVVMDDPGWPTSRAYDPPVTPTLFLIGPTGRVEAATWGFSKADLNALSERIAQHLGDPPKLVAQRDDGNPDARPG